MATLICHDICDMKSQLARKEFLTLHKGVQTKQEVEMRYGLISLLPLQIARLLLLVRSIEAVQLEDDKPPQWVILVKGRGFTRILRDELLASPALMRPASWNSPRPMRFPSRLVAVSYAQCIGLLPRRSSWTIKQTGAGNGQGK